MLKFVIPKTLFIIKFSESCIEYLSLNPSNIMKQIFTFLFALCFAIGLSAQPVYIWGGPGDPNSEFNGGLNDWTTVGVGSSIPDSAKNAVWIWDADGTDAGDPYQGAFSGATTIIESPSVANGVM